MMMSHFNPRLNRVLGSLPANPRSRPNRRQRQRLSLLILAVTVVAFGSAVVALFLLSLAS